MWSDTLLWSQVQSQQGQLGVGVAAQVQVVRAVRVGRPPGGRVHHPVGAPVSARGHRVCAPLRQPLLLV